MGGSELSLPCVRRICPGRHFADVNTWFAIANITAALDIRRLRDADGKELIPTASFAPGIARCVGNKDLHCGELIVGS
ncbi:uncharacterized protein LAESUDRAFT_730907 [Laetiporus sulphureus 93-53]|uniref:Uncharacterized protein n=1 Tax=Laetiporus sulphureus 93-53 TaxID=1314785 RepID=A0A165BXI7_9APHY|nr:uncharacterized protein LAESUDRAFT_730907 [Laetiporus sulphureus 93-53]KZT01835.1 hypothetical protein LAESUDRAFT_730907 [Laetiporus sulphureus 93-53]